MTKVVLSNGKSLLAQLAALLALLLMLVVGVTATPAANAQLRVDISGVGATQYPIAIADCSGDPAGQTIADITRADLTRSGLFKLINAIYSLLRIDSAIDYSHLEIN